MRQYHKKKKKAGEGKLGRRQTPETIRILCVSKPNQSALALPPFVRKGKTFRLVYVSSSPPPSPALCEGPLGFPWARGHVKASLVSLLAVVAPQASRGLVSPGTFSAGLNAIELRVDTLSLLMYLLGGPAPCKDAARERGQCCLLLRPVVLGYLTALLGWATALSSSPEASPLCG